MKNQASILLLTLILILSCDQNDKIKEIKIERDLDSIKVKIAEKENFINSFVTDSTIEKKIAFDFIKISNTIDTDSIISVCNCDKNIKDNSIKIQLATGIPTQKELDTMSKNSNRKWNTVLQTKFGPMGKFSGQFKFINIQFKDSLVKEINIYSKSTDNEYNGNNFDSLNVKRFKIVVSKFDYSIASEVYGKFEFRLDRDFGLFKNDTILKGRFLCNNWVIRNKENIKSGKLNKI